MFTNLFMCDMLYVLLLCICLFSVKSYGTLYSSTDEQAELHQGYTNVNNNLTISQNSFTIPLGVSEISLTVYNANANDENKISSVSATFAVAPNDLIEVLEDYTGSCDQYYGTQINNNGNMIVYLSPLSVDSLGNKMAANHECLKYADNVNAEYNFVHSQATNINYNMNIIFNNQPLATIGYVDTCPEGYTNLKSDFNPILLSSSTLKRINDEPRLQLDFKLPYYYHSVEAFYPDQCHEGTVVEGSTKNVGCEIYYYTTLDYTKCPNFTLEVNPNNSEEYLYRGIIRVKAKISLDVNDFQVERYVESPINWQVYLDRTVTVSSDVNINNPHTCETAAECNNNGCCEDGYCNCQCEEYKNGYDGKYCDEDIEKPTCDIPTVLFTKATTSGGCVYLDDDHYFNSTNVPDFDDNSDVFYAKYKIKYANGDESSSYDIINEDFSSLKQECFDIGTHQIIFDIQDVPFTNPNATDNEKTSCSLNIVIEDESIPFVDCHRCNDDNSTVNICTALKGTTNFDKVQVANNELIDYFNAEVLSNAEVFYAGSVINYADGVYKFIDCDCNLMNEEPIISIVTNTWDSWGRVNAYDVNDAHLTYNYPDVPLDDGNYPLNYRVEDDDGNVGSCNIGVTYDITAPTCEGFENLEVPVDENNKNFSVPVDFGPVKWNADIAGKDLGPILTPYRTSGDVYHVGYAYNATYESIYWLTDLAGNNGTCPWKIIVQNPEPCLYPVCDDLPPFVVDGTCPNNFDVYCENLGTCGCSDFTPPQFKDDKFVKKIEVYIDGVLFETYNNDETSSLPQEQLDLGNYNITYIAYDMHNQTAECNFEISILDTIPPVYSSCPDTETFKTVGDALNHSFSYSFGIDDECMLNEKSYLVGGLLPDAHDTNALSKTDVLAIGSYSYEYSATDDSGNVAYCRWNITIEDGGIPNITCPNDVVQRISQGDLETLINFNYEAYDAIDGDLTNQVLIYINELNINYTAHTTPLQQGNYTFELSVSDSANNENSCSFQVEILESYPYGSMTPALIDAEVREFVDDNGDVVFGSELDIITLSNAYHRVDNIIQDPVLTSNNNDNIDNDYNIQEIPGVSDCEYDHAICWQYFKFFTTFQDCEIDGEKYDVTATQICKPNDCNEEKTYSFTVSLTAANYCWQNLADILVNGELIMIQKSVHDAFEQEYINNPMNVTFPISATVFNNNDEISGIVRVYSDQVQTKSIEIIAANKQFYTDKLYENIDQTIDLSDAAKLSYHNWASFSYIETDIPLETTFYTRFEATAAITYDLGNTSLDRRRLLTMRSMLQDNQLNNIVTKDVMISSMEDQQLTFATNEAVIMITLNQCTIITNEWKDDIINVIANVLRISKNRINIYIDKDLDDSIKDSCFVTVAIRESDCDGIDIMFLIKELEYAVKDQFSLLHQLFLDSDTIPDHITINPTLFYIVQTPDQYVQIDDALTSSSNTSTNHLFNNQIKLYDNWYLYVIAGMLLGFMVIYMYNKCTASSATMAGQKYAKFTVPEQRTSIADLLQKNQQQVNNVNFHS